MGGCSAARQLRRVRGPPRKVSRRRCAFQLKEVNRHPWACAGVKGELELEAPMMEVVQTHIIPSRDAIDEDVLRGITSLGCFKEKEKLVDALLESSHNTGEQCTWSNRSAH